MIVRWVIQNHFNSRPHEEVDPIASDTKTASDAFQLTTSRRGRPFCLNNSTSRNYFNSRPHEEVDGGVKLVQLWLQNFNSRPHEEVDALYRDFFGIIMEFQLTTSRRGRHGCCGHRQRRRDISTHDLTKRSTSLVQSQRYPLKYFNSRPHEEVDDSTVDNAKDKYISTHDLTKRSTEDIAKLDTRATFQLTTSRRGRLENS